jgi:hypothetical protein
MIELVADDGGDDHNDDERRALHEALSKTWDSAEAGRTSCLPSMRTRKSGRGCWLGSRRRPGCGPTISDGSHLPRRKVGSRFGVENHGVLGGPKPPRLLLTRR